MKCGVCTFCGDTYRLPENFDVNKEYTCLCCGKVYIPKIVVMEEFVFNRLKNTKMS